MSDHSSVEQVSPSSKTSNKSKSLWKASAKYFNRAHFHSKTVKPKPPIMITSSITSKKLRIPFINQSQNLLSSKLQKKVQKSIFKNKRPKKISDSFKSKFQSISRAKFKFSDAIVKMPNPYINNTDFSTASRSSSRNSEDTGSVILCEPEQNYTQSLSFDLENKSDNSTILPKYEYERNNLKSYSLISSPTSTFDNITTELNQSFKISSENHNGLSTKVSSWINSCLELFLIWKVVIRPVLIDNNFFKQASLTDTNAKLIKFVSFISKIPEFTKTLTFHLLLLFIFIAIWLYYDQRVGIYCNQEVIPNIPLFENGGYPLFGNLFQLGKSAPLRYWEFQTRINSLSFRRAFFPQRHLYKTDPRSSYRYQDTVPTNGNNKGSLMMFQARLGYRRIVVVNGFDTTKNLWVTNWASNASRPILYAFHKILSQSESTNNSIYKSLQKNKACNQTETSGTTIGTTPYGKSWKSMKSVAAKALNSPSIIQYTPIIESESSKCIDSIEQALDKSSSSEIDIRSFFEMFALKVSLAVAYGYYPGDNLSEDNMETKQLFLEEIVDVEKQINKIRSSLYSLEDYLPFVRSKLFGRMAKSVIEYFRTKSPFQVQTHSLENSQKNTFLSEESVLEIRSRRAKYMNELMSGLKLRMSNKDPTLEYKPCIIGNILKSGELSESELNSVCLTMVSAGLDTIPVNIISAIGHLSTSEYGQKIQERAYHEIMETYFDDDSQSFNLNSLDVESTTFKPIPYIMAIIKESMRHSSAQPINLARELISDIKFNKDITIPKGTMLIMNTLAVNFDSSRFQDPFKFDPERYLDYEYKEVLQNDIYPTSVIKRITKLSTGSGMSHFSFGGGMRMCAGYKLAEREMYIVLLKVILKYKILPPLDEANDGMDTDIIHRFDRVDSLVIEPNHFKLRLVPR